MFENGKEAHLVIDTEIKSPKSEVWNLLATTEGITKWFPQMRAEDLPASGKLSFTDGELYEEMFLLEYVEKAIISYKWDIGKVSFNIQEFAPGNTLLHFEAFLPYEFKNIAQDLTGWTMQLEHLKAVAEETPYKLDKGLMEQRSSKFQALLAERVN